MSISMRAVFILCVIFSATLTSKGTYASTERPPNELRLLSLNVWQFTDGIGSTHNQERAEKLAKIIQEKTDEFDVIAFQELWSSCRRHFIYDQIQSLYPYHVEAHDRRFWVGYHSGLAIYSKYPIKDLFHHNFSVYRGPEDFAKKGVLGVKLDVKGKTVYLATTHLQAGDGGDFFRFFDRFKPSTTEISAIQLKEARQAIRDFATEPGAPIFFIGDLNIVYGNDEYRTGLTALEDSTDTFDTSQSKYIGTSWNDFPSNNKIDYIFTLSLPVQGYSRVIDWFGADVTDHLGIQGLFML